MQGNQRTRADAQHIDIDSLRSKDQQIKMQWRVIEAVIRGQSAAAHIFCGGQLRVKRKGAV